MTTPTTNYAFGQPTVGADADVWGALLNAIFVSIDKLMGSVTTTGSGAAYVLTTGQSLSAYATGQRFRIKASFTCNAAATINVDGLGAKNITKNGTTATVSGDIVSGVVYDLTYDGTQFQALNVVGVGAQPLDAKLSAIAALTWADDRMLDLTGTSSIAVVTYATVLSNIVAVAKAGDTMSGNLSITKAGTANTSLTVGNANNTISAFVDNDYSGLIQSANVPVIFYNNNTERFRLDAGASVQFTADIYYAGVTTPFSAGSVGYRGAGPANVKTADYTTAITDEGHALDMNSGSAHAITIKATTHTANAELFGVNMGAGVLTLTRDTGVTFRDGAGANANQTVNQYQQWYARRDPSTDNLWYVRVS